MPKAHTGKRNMTHCKMNFTKFSLRRSMSFPFHEAAKQNATACWSAGRMAGFSAELGLTHESPFIVRSCQTSISLRFLPETEFLAELGTTGVPSFIAGCEGVGSRKSLTSEPMELRPSEGHSRDWDKGSRDNPELNSRHFAATNSAKLRLK